MKALFHLNGYFAVTKQDQQVAQKNPQCAKHCGFLLPGPALKAAMALVIEG
ncbi:hypothetical protein [Polaromonas naphthalenivorans]|uniref:hypothetical protein n=1 Tax=Polaromonas naphthalenivorans TaxID=216465 RepID=UPI0002F36599|nr:hypothetical protein [Polaromonas naphthalenivorans]